MVPAPAGTPVHLPGRSCDDDRMTLTLPIEDGANELLSRDPLAMGLGAAAWLAMAVSFVPMLRLYRCPLLLALLLPAIAAFYMAVTVGSAFPRR